MPDNVSNKKRPVLATIIAISLLIFAPFIILTSVVSLKNPLYKAKSFDLIPKVASKFLPQIAPRIDTEGFLDALSENLKIEYSSRMNDPQSSMRRIETYNAVSSLILAIATIFICVGILRLKKWAYKLIIIRLLLALFLITPLVHLSSKHMNEVVASAISKSLYNFPQLEGDEGEIDILKVITKDRVKKQNRLPLVAGVVWNLFMIGYFLHPGVRRTLNTES